MEKVGCDFCGKLDSRPYMPSLKLVQCLGCGLIYAGERLSFDKLSEIYNQDYFKSPESSELGYDDYEANKPDIYRTFLRRLKAIEKYLGGKAGKLLDVGCALGFFLETARERGWNAEGIDISRYCVESALSRGLKVHHSTLQEQALEPASLDLVTMWDYIEHSPAPKNDLEKAHEILKKGGILALTTPDISSWPAGIFKSNWMGFKMHEHLYYFSGKILARILERMGFKILKREYAGKYVSTEFFIRRLGMYFPNLSRGLAFGLGKRWIPNLHFYCNPWDITLILAQKA